MEKITILGDLVIYGDIDCFDGGLLWAHGGIVFGCSDNDLPFKPAAIFPEGLVLKGKEITVDGNAYITGYAQKMEGVCGQIVAGSLVCGNCNPVR